MQKAVTKDQTERLCHCLARGEWKARKRRIAKVRRREGRQAVEAQA